MRPAARNQDKAHFVLSASFAMTSPCIQQCTVRQIVIMRQKGGRRLLYTNRYPKSVPCFQSTFRSISSSLMHKDSLDGRRTDSEMRISVRIGGPLCAEDGQPFALDQTELDISRAEKHSG